MNIRIAFALFVAAIVPITAPVRSFAGPALPSVDRIRLAEAFRLADSLGGRLWSDWYRAPFAVLLVTPQREFLLRHPRPSADFDSLGYDSLLASQVWSRPRHFDLHFLATFPALGSTPIIVIGQAESTQARTSTPWVLTLLHEHFHQLQYSRSDYVVRVDSLHLARGDTTGMWMLDYPFPYSKPEVMLRFARLDSALVVALRAEGGAFQRRVAEYLEAKKAVRSAVSADDYRYLQFQLWQEGIARYTEYRMAEIAAQGYQPSAAFRDLADVVPYREQADKARRRMERELALPLDRAQRVVVYPLGAGEGLLLDRLNPRWRERYFERMFALDEAFTSR